MTSTDHERRVDIAATVLARGVRRVLGNDLTPEHGAVERENNALPVRATEAVMGAVSNQEKTTR
jgi:N-methylhydantoinase A/oxoprolinase/acetone carboxylase beta subunit